MNTRDEELQNKIELGHESDDIDSRSYSTVFQALRQEPEFKLPGSFADRVVAMAESKRKSSSSDFLWFGVGIFFLVIAFIVVIVMTGFKLDLGFLSGISSYYGLFVFGGLFIGLLNLLEKKVLRKRLPSN
jgi:hypothetical protein